MGITCHSLHTDTGRSHAAATFVPPSAGMFVWVELCLGDMPDKTDEEDGSVLTPERQFWSRLADARLFAATGWCFSPAKHAEGSVFPLGKEGAQVGHFRLSYMLSDVSFFPW
jgi:hypothetical protein